MYVSVGKSRDYIGGAAVWGKYGIEDVAGAALDDASAHPTRPSLAGEGLRSLPFSKPLPYPSCYVVLAGAAAEGVRALRVVVSIRRGIDCRHVFC